MERTLLGVHRVCQNGARSAVLYICSVVKEICVYNVTLFWSLPKSLRALEDYEDLWESPKKSLIPVWFSFIICHILC